MNKETLKTIIMTVLIIALLFAIMVICIGKNLIDDLTTTSNYYKEHYNQCRVELDSIMNDYERLQDE